VDHADAGFVATPEETWRLQKEIWSRGMVEVAAFHSHQRHPANFSEIDYHMHMRRFPDLWHLIVSMRNPQLPQVRAVAVSERGVRELPVSIARNRRREAPPGRILHVTR
jgi:proteasome lid subunit RPN8/RPN11